MIYFIKTQIKKILFLFLKKENAQILKILNNFETDLNILDIGATGGIQKKWHLIENILNVSMVEPNANSYFGKNNFKSTNLISKLFSNEDRKIVKFNITDYNWCSSINKPNFEHLNKYKGKIGFFSKDSYKVLKEIELNTTTIDKSFENKKLDFIKIDAEGHHYEILQGAREKLKTVLGLEVECEFFQLRKDQKLFYDVMKLLNDNNFEFTDFLVIHRWERDKFRFTGQPQHSDLLFLKKPEQIIKEFNEKKIVFKIMLKYILILTIYNRVDLIKLILNHLDESSISKYSLNKLYSLVEKKVHRLNKFKQFENFISQTTHNEI